jgi:hypothetical protein
MNGLRYAGLDSVATEGDTRSTYTETVRGDGMEVRLSWMDIGETFALEMPVSHSATGKHIMLSVFAGAGRASDRRRPGAAGQADPARHGRPADHQRLPRLLRNLDPSVTP